MGKRGPKPIPRDDDRIRRLNAEGKDDVEISLILGISQGTVYRYRREMKIPRVIKIDGAKRWSRCEITEFIEEYVRRNRGKVLT